MFSRETLNLTVSTQLHFYGSVNIMTDDTLWYIKPDLWGSYDYSNYGNEGDLLQCDLATHWLSEIDVWGKEEVCEVWELKGLL